MWNVPHTHSRTTTAFACIFQCFFCQQVQQSCNSSSASPEPTEEQHESEMVKMTKSKTFQAYLPNCHRTYSCIHCRAHLANHDELISKVSKTNTGTHILARIQANTHTHTCAHTYAHLRGPSLTVFSNVMSHFTFIYSHVVGSGEPQDNTSINP